MTERKTELSFSKFKKQRSSPPTVEESGLELLGDAALKLTLELLYHLLALEVRMSRRQ